MKLTNSQLSLLVQLRDLALADSPADVGLLAWQLDCTHRRVRATLEGLARLGLVDDRRIRLTLGGLCVAQSARSAASRRIATPRAA